MIVPEKRFMLEAIGQANLARESGDYAIGAVIVKENEVFSRGIHGTRLYQDPTRHAEMEAIREVVSKQRHRHLDGCVIYTTHEPCSMCTSAIIYAKLSGVVYGANIEYMRDYAEFNGNGNWSWRTFDIKAHEIATKGNPKIEVVGSFMREECLKLFHNS